METDIGNPIDYNPLLDDVPEEKDESNEKPPREEEYYFHPSEYQHQQQQQFQEKESFDLFKNVEKSTWIIAFAVFLLGFFMGKTMQPVILRYA